MGTTICITIVVLLLLIFFGVMIYHQMLLVNEINKRLMLQNKELIEHDRITQEEYNDLLSRYNSEVANPTKQKNEEDELVTNEDEEPFNPHDYTI